MGNLSIYVFIDLTPGSTCTYSSYIQALVDYNNW